MDKKLLPIRTIPLAALFSNQANERRGDFPFKIPRGVHGQEFLDL